MHELGIAQNILPIVQQSVAKELEADVREIRLRVGQLSGIAPDSRPEGSLKDTVDTVGG